MQKQILILLAILVVAGGWYFLASNAPERDQSVENAENVVATVNGEEISRTDFDNLKTQVMTQQGTDQSQLDEETQDQFELEIVNQLITQKLLAQAVERSGVVASEEDIDGQVDTLVAQVGGEEAFQEVLAGEDFTEDEIREEIAKNFSIQSYLNQELDLASLSASDEEIMSMYSQVSSQNEAVPELEEIRGQIEGMVIEQKQQSLIAQHIEELRENADVKIFL